MYPKNCRMSFLTENYNNNTLPDSKQGEMGITVNLL